MTPTILEKGLLRLAPTSSQQFAFQFAALYELFAQTAIPTPVLAGARARMEGVLASAFNPRSGAPPKAVNAIVQGITVFWLGVPVGGGVVTAFLGASALQTCLTARLSNPRITLAQAASGIATCLDAATRLVQYVIPPGPPLFLV